MARYLCILRDPKGHIRNLTTIVADDPLRAVFDSRVLADPRHTDSFELWRENIRIHREAVRRPCVS